MNNIIVISPRPAPRSQYAVWFATVGPMQLIFTASTPDHSFKNARRLDVGLMTVMQLSEKEHLYKRRITKTAIKAIKIKHRAWNKHRRVRGGGGQGVLTPPFSWTSPFHL